MTTPDSSATPSPQDLDAPDLAHAFHTAHFLEHGPQGYCFDLGQKRVAYVLSEEFAHVPDPLPGQEVELLVEDPQDDQEATWSASVQKAMKLRAFETFEALAKEHAVIEGVIVGEQRGGLIVDVGVRAFLPWSHVDLHRVEDASRYLGKHASFEILDFDKERCQFILSRKKVLKREQKTSQKELAATLEPGQRYTGIVRGIKPYGAFVDIGGIQGLLHVSDMSWGRINHAQELVAMGDELDVVVINYDEGKKRLKLGRKQLLPDPWTTVPLGVGDVVEGKVVSLTTFGAFVQLAPGLEGLIHITEFSWTQRITHPKDVLHPGQQVKVVVLDVDQDARRISLSLKQLGENPWETVAAELPVGSRIKGTITSVVDFGLFVEVVPGIEGLVHTSNLSWSDRDGGPDAQDHTPGKEIEVMVLDVDPQAQRLDLSVKHLTQDPWAAAATWIQPGQKVSATITKLAEFGAFALVSDQVEGLIHISELREDRVEQVQSVVRVGQVVDALILSFDAEGQRLSLSLKRESLEDDAALSGYTDQDITTNTLGDILREQLGLSATEDAPQDLAEEPLTHKEEEE